MPKARSSKSISLEYQPPKAALKLTEAEYFITQKLVEQNQSAVANKFLRDQFGIDFTVAMQITKAIKSKLSPVQAQPLAAFNGPQATLALEADLIPF